MDFATGFAAGLAFGKKKFGGGGEIEHDPDYQEWLDLPEPSETQAVILIQPMIENIYVSFDIKDNAVDTSEEIIIDWGDGSKEVYNSDEQRVNHNYAKTGKYIIIFSFSDSTTFKEIRQSSYSEYQIMAKFGKNVLIKKVGGYTNFGNNLRYVKLSTYETPSDDALGYFRYCYSLSEVEWEGEINALTDYMFLCCYRLKFESLKFNLESFDVPRSCFSECGRLTSMNFPFNKVTSIGEYAFSYCSELKKVTMPNCTYVGNNAFHSDHNLVEVTFSDECTFGTNCFSGCCSLRPKPDGTL